ncbi:hypothetical protein NMNM586_1319 [Neisseria meningitidis NM586]|nr:hypothetical protein NMNM586_1319 [Neisseria meningitidis NM586]
MIIAFATIQYIVTIIAVQGVVAFSSIERIIAIATVLKKHFIMTKAYILQDIICLRTRCFS